MIIVTGATGQLGHAIVKELVKRLPVNEVGVSTRDPSKVEDFSALGIRVRAGDFSDPASLHVSFEGATQILLVSSNARAKGDDPLIQHRSVIDAAKKVGAKRIVYTSQMAASSESAFPPMRDHAASEMLLAESGLSWTALRHGFYGASGVAMMADALKTGLLETAQDGKFSWVAHDDLAEAAAIVLTEEGKFDGPTPPFTGSELLDFGDLANIATILQDKSIKRTILSDHLMRTKLIDGGLSESAVNMVLGMYIGARNGEWATLDPTLANLLGRPLISMKELLTRQLTLQ